IEENAFCSSRLIIADYQPSHFLYCIVLKCSGQFSELNRHYSFRVVKPVIVRYEPRISRLNTKFVVFGLFNDSINYPSLTKYAKKLEVRVTPSFFNVSPISDSPN
uniref:hypothetical protein n=3 Tax=Lactiplantibacillus TaxID=2767842 RepID=UPI001C1F51B4